MRTSGTRRPTRGMLLGMALDDYHLRKGSWPPSHSPVVMKYYNLGEFFGEDFVIDYIVKEYFSPRG